MFNKGKIMTKIIKSENTIARQHNDFITAPQSLTQNAFKFFMLAISKIKTTDKDLPEIVLTLDDFKRAFAPVRTKEHIRFDFVDQIAGELKSSDAVKIKQGTKTIHINFVDTIISDSHDNTFRVSFKREMHPFLLELKHYTKSRVELICSFRSYYSSRIYQILKMYFGKTIGEEYAELVVEIVRLREMLSLNEGVYSNYAQLKREVIEKAKKEINNNLLSDIKFSYEELKGIGSKKVVGLKFQIHRNDFEKNETIGIISQEDRYKTKYNEELNLTISELIKNITTSELNSIKKCAASLAKGLSDEEILEHNLFKAWVLMSKILPDSKRYLDSFEDWCIENKIEIQVF